MMNQKLYSNQKGSALLLAFILLIALTFIAIASVNTGVMETRMAGSVEEDMNAFQVAASGIDFVLSDDAYLPTTTLLGTPVTVVTCTNGACTTNPSGITLPGTTFDTGGSSGEETIDLIATRTEDCGLPPRTSTAASLLNFSSFGYEVESKVDKTDNNRGRSNQLTGFMTLGPKC